MQEMIFWWKTPIRLVALTSFIVGLLLLFFALVMTQQPEVHSQEFELLNAETAPDTFFRSVETDSTLPEASLTTPTDTTLVVVAISGAIQYPDAYELPHNARIKDVVLAAGGFTADADHEKVNLAARIQDEQHIHIPRIGAIAQSEDEDTDNTDATSKGQININTASAAELEDLPGIGQKLSERIIAYRTENGPFATADALGDVPGVGAKLLDDLRPFITATP